MTSTIAKGLVEFVNPYKLPKFTKQVHIQMREIEGRQPFGQGLYHSNHYENLVKSLVESRKQYRTSKDVAQRKDIAESELKQWDYYVELRSKELPDDFHLTDQMAVDLKRSFDVFVARNEKELRPKYLLEVFNDYTRVHQFKIPIDNWCVLQMVHYNLGYLMNLSRLLPFNDLRRLLEIKVLATYEKSLGQDLLFRELISYGYWKMLTKKGYTTCPEFAELMQVFKYSLQPNLSSVLKEFGFAANLFPGEFPKEIDPKEEVVRFDFFRYVFLERNL